MVKLIIFGKYLQHQSIFTAIIVCDFTLLYQKSSLFLNLNESKYDLTTFDYVPEIYYVMHQIKKFTITC